MNDGLKLFITSKNSSKRIFQISPIKTPNKKTNISSKVIVEKNKVRQEILGFGGSFTESSSSIYKKLNQNKKEEIIEAYFGERGNKYSMARTHINSCDFSLGNYAHVEKENDPDLNTFSLERNRVSLIPLIKDALQKRKNKISNSHELHDAIHLQVMFFPKINFILL